MGCSLYCSVQFVSTLILKKLCYIKKAALTAILVICRQDIKVNSLVHIIFQFIKCVKEHGNQDLFQLGIFLNINEIMEKIN